MKNTINRRRLLALSAGMATAAAVGSTSLFTSSPRAFADTQLALTIAVTQAFPQTYTHIVQATIAAPQLATRGASGLFCYDRNANIGSFYATVQNGFLDDGTPVVSGLLKIGGNHTFDHQWTHIVSMFGGPQLVFYDATTGTGAIYLADAQGNLTLQRIDSTWRTTWTQIVSGSFGNANLLFYDATGHTGQFYFIDSSGNMQVKHTDSTWRSSWYSIIKTRFSNSGGFDDLVFYDRNAGFGAFYRFDSSGRMIVVSQHSNWRTSWKYIVSGDFAQFGSAFGLLFYEDGTGATEIYSMDTGGNISLIPVSFPNQWSLPWQSILGGEFVPWIGTSGWGKLINYDPLDGVMVSSYLFPVF